MLYYQSVPFTTVRRFTRMLCCKYPPSAQTEKYDAQICYCSLGTNVCCHGFPANLQMFGGTTSSVLPDTSSNELRDIVASLPHRYTALGGSILHVVFYVTFDLRHMKLLQGSERTEPKAAAKYDASPMACNEKDLISENISRNVALSCTSPKSFPTH